MKDNFDLIQLFKTIWAKRKRLFLWTGIGLVLGVIISISMPNEYVCDVLIAPESKDQSGNSRNSLSGLASMMGVGSFGGSSRNGLNEMVYSEIVSSPPFLEQFGSMIVNYNGEEMTLQNYLNQNTKMAWWNYILGAPSMILSMLNGDSDQTKEGETNRYILSTDQGKFQSNLESRISADIDKTNGLITVIVRMQDPIIAAQVADSLVLKLNSFIINYRTSKTRADLAVNETMMSNARNKYYLADEQYAQAVDRNQNLITKSAAIGIDRLRNERDLALQVYQQLASQVEFTRTKLQEDTPIVTVINPPLAPKVADSPKKKLITIVLALLFAIGYCGVILFKELSNGSASEKIN